MFALYKIMKFAFIILFLICFLVGSLYISAFSIREYYDGIPPQLPPSQIPLKIYQTWKTKELPEKMRENVERMKIKKSGF